MEEKPFSELEPEMRTGDLVLFSGRYEESELIEKLEHSPWSHVGMIDPLTRMLVEDHGLPNPSEWKMIVEVAEGPRQYDTDNAISCVITFEICSLLPPYA